MRRKIVEDINCQFTDFKKMPFPTGLGGKEINGVELVLTDAQAAGLIEDFISSKTGLDSARYQSLVIVKTDLSKIIDYLPTHSRAYFRILNQLVEKIISVDSEQS